MRFTPDRTLGLSATELYLFDTMGFVKIPQFLSAATAQDCREEAARLPSRLMAGRGDKERLDDLVTRSGSFDALARSEAMLGCVEPVINQPFRLIESYALRRDGPSIFYLHNGNSEMLRYGRDRSVQRNMSLNHSYHDGKLFCMFVKVLIYLTDVHDEEDGPFCHLHGSHKANFPWFPCPESHVARPELNRQNFPSLASVPTSAGDALVLNEALLHGTLPKTSEGERLVLAFSYAPAFVTDWKEIDIASDDIAKLGHY